MKTCLAWALYLCGCTVSHAMSMLAKLGGVLYPLYNWLMLTSYLTQGNNKGPWTSDQSTRD